MLKICVSLDLDKKYRIRRIDEVPSSGAVEIYICAARLILCDPFDTMEDALQWVDDNIGELNYLTGSMPYYK
jgi:hypothetical protein